MAAAVAAVTSPDLFSFHASIAPLPAPPAGAEDDDGDFEFRIPAAVAALSAADELFSDGKLVPLLPLLNPASACSAPPCVEEEPPSEPVSPRAPRCAGRRWRDLLLLVTKKPKAGEAKGRAEASLGRREAHSRPLLSRDSSSSSSASSCDSGRNARRPPPPSRPPLRTRSAPVASLLHLMSKKNAGDCRNGAAAAAAPKQRQQQQACAHPLLTRASSSSSASSSDSGRNSRPPWHPHGPARPWRPAIAAESPRVSASGRVVFRGLERCSSTPAAAGIGGLRRPRPRGMERSYSTNVRVDPVINVFGFGHLFFPASPAKEKKADAAGGGRRSRPEKLAMMLRDPQD
ncbi:hypothetical protein CFC21_018983 [Triticum aestivum]|uniref:Uncharacterized protein n=2 Tax=Triticum aestivum TaxID=4565 RepID=A0A9R1E4K5_WHEAT|nr:uncharacterized protein LOC119290624 [Triticum dicoccoides]XP_037479345.1 uncharacterized protein LOC119356491 [Triticum dicoccoides]XP_044459029.1 uncharacterized protein LOC123190451 [Triticum aestivum]KAF7003694.1 hypothetical protein CFC21_018983 [Triticum aestivum]